MAIFSPFGTGTATPDESIVDRCTQNTVIWDTYILPQGGNKLKQLMLSQIPSNLGPGIASINGTRAWTNESIYKFTNGNKRLAGISG